MPEKYIDIVFEDQLSEAVLCRLLEYSHQKIVIHQKIPGNGCDYIKRRIPAYLAASRIIPFVILLDSDKEDCAKRMLDELVPIERRHDGFLLRIAVREVESWLLADHHGFGKFLGISPALIERQPDTLDKTKEYLIDLARRSRKRDILEGIVPQFGTSAKQGPRYNQVLQPFVRNIWNIPSAAKRSESLRRSLDAIKKATFKQ
jgi:hypothetical protein